MNDFSPFVTPLHLTEVEPLANGGQIEYEFFPIDLDVISCLLYYLCQERWQDIGIGHMVDGSVLELEFKAPPKICKLYDGYLTVVTESWHLHLCIAENWGGPDRRTSLDQRQARLVSRAALYRRFNPAGEPRSWGIQFWNGLGVKMMTFFLPNPFVGENEDLLSERQPNLAKLQLYEELRGTYILGTRPLPYDRNPLTKRYISVCRSSRCLPSRQYQPVYEALQAAVEEANLAEDVEVCVSGCLEVCKMGPVVFYSADRTWYTRVTPAVAKQIVQEHLVEGKPISKHVYP
ncbi:MAG: (Fe-S)-binding protein [Cyanobacteria bacterium M5B4]|nr:MAG: (Fe-S)-binding protein [Cyanobacteria bacterium M5B4]